MHFQRAFADFALLCDYDFDKFRKAIMWTCTWGGMTHNSVFFQLFEIKRKKKSFRVADIWKSPHSKSMLFLPSVSFSFRFNFFVFWFFERKLVVNPTPIRWRRFRAWHSDRKTEKMGRKRERERERERERDRAKDVPEVSSCNSVRFSLRIISN